MARQKRIKKIRMPSFVRDVTQIVLKKAINFIAVSVFLLALALIAVVFLCRSDYFKVRVVETRPAAFDSRASSAIKKELLDLYGGKNVFKINLRAIAKSLEASYPNARDVVVFTALPDRIVVNIRFRKPVALVRDWKLYPVDEEGVVLRGSSADSVNGLPIIEGVSIRYAQKRGRQNLPRNLTLALELLKEMKLSRLMPQYAPDRISAPDSNNLSFYLKNGLEIKVGGEDFKRRLERLIKTLKDPRLIMDNIAYIDVRFEDVVVGPK